MKALSIRLPWAELILKGEKTVEVRLMRTAKRGERVYVYAGKARIEPEEEARIAAKCGIDLDSPPGGVLVGTVGSGHANRAHLRPRWSSNPDPP